MIGKQQDIVCIREKVVTKINAENKNRNWSWTVKGIEAWDGSCYHSIPIMITNKDFETFIIILAWNRNIPLIHLADASFSACLVKK